MLDEGRGPDDKGSIIKGWGCQASVRIQATRVDSQNCFAFGLCDIREVLTHILSLQTCFS